MLVEIVSSQDISILMNKTVPSENVLKNVHTVCGKMLKLPNVLTVSLISVNIVLIVPQAQSVLNVLLQLSSMKVLVLLLAQLDISEIPLTTNVNSVTLNVLLVLLVIMEIVILVLLVNSY